MTFPSIKKEELFKKVFAKGLSDPTLNKFRPLTFSPAYNPKYQKDKAEWEYINSFIYSSECLLDYIPDGSTGMYAFTDISIPLVIAYLCRHSIELTIKKLITELDITIDNKEKTTHNLCLLWGKCENAISDLNPQEKAQIIAMRKFISYVNEIDHSGTKFRYAASANGNLSCPKLLFVNCNLLVNSTKLFANELRNFISQKQG